MNDPLVKKSSILIIDDTPENLTVLRKMLTEFGYRIRPAINADIALKTIRSDPPDLILLYILMPDMDGYVLCDILKSDPGYKKTGKRVPDFLPAWV